jgi:light-regulated signal transduction histidine kinase (bacteriophytochrome)
MEIQYVVEDIMRNKQYDTYHQTLSNILDQCSDELTALLTEENGEESIIERVRARIDETYGSKDFVSIHILLNEFVNQRLVHLGPSFSHRHVNIISRLDSVPAICIPVYVLEKVIDGLVKNAVENTPDGGKIEVIVRKKGQGVVLVLRDYGVGITEEHKRRIFEGFFTTRDTLAYSSKKPFDFNAGGKGADLLRLKIFSERFNFKIDMNSSRCRYIPQASDTCPGRISECSYCTQPEDCYPSGGTTFSLYFQPAPQ